MLCAPFLSVKLASMKRSPALACDSCAKLISGSLRFVLFATAVTALGGFLFGYDTAVINGANSLLQLHFNLDPNRDSLLIGLATASAILGCIPGIAAGFISDRWGRRRVLFFCALLYAVSGVLSAIPQTFWHFIAARILSGIAIGIRP